MSPEESQRLQACLKEAAAILYRHTSPEKLRTFESLEKVVRQMMLEQVGPQIAFFLSPKLQEQTREENE